MSTRSKAREVALQMLYQQDLNPDMDFHTVRELIAHRLPNEQLAEFSWHLFIGVMDVRNDLDQKIEKIAQNWSLKRMAPTDRNVLRLGAYELTRTSTPPRVVIDEALELAKLFGSSQSSQFVNGILDRLIPQGRRESLEVQQEDEDLSPEESAAPRESEEPSSDSIPTC